MSLEPFILQARVRIHADSDAERAVTYSDLAKEGGGSVLSEYMADRAPLFYRDPSKIAQTLHAGFFLSAFREGLRRLPTSERFHDSHFAEILSVLFAVQLMGLRLVYSKLSLLTTENANPNKMDLILYVPESDPVTFVLGEVKSSMKSEAPAKHNRSCYADLFQSLKKYSEDALYYDLNAARDHIGALPDEERETVQAALLPYANRKVLYAGFVVIDATTRDPSETAMLATRKCERVFDVDLVCVEDLASVSHEAFEKLEVLREHV